VNNRERGIFRARGDPSDSRLEEREPSPRSDGHRRREIRGVDVRLVDLGNELVQEEVGNDAQLVTASQIELMHEKREELDERLANRLGSNVNRIAEEGDALPKEERNGIRCLGVAGVDVSRRREERDSHIGMTRLEIKTSRREVRESANPLENGNPREEHMLETRITVLLQILSLLSVDAKGKIECETIKVRWTRIIRDLLGEIQELCQAQSVESSSGVGLSQEFARE